jgi:ligand-binding sensor domain-containing protein
MKRVKPVVNQLFCAAMLLLFLPCLIFAEQLPIKIYTTSNGLVSNKISRIVRDSRGFLWFCTEQGLSRFDGYRFTNYTMDEGLPDNEVNDLLKTRSAIIGWRKASACADFTRRAALLLQNPGP